MHAHSFLAPIARASLTAYDSWGCDAGEPVQPAATTKPAYTMKAANGVYTPADSAQKQVCCLDSLQLPMKP